MLERLMLSGARVTVIVEYAETLLPAADLAALGPDERDLLVTLLRWGSAPELQASRFLRLPAGPEPARPARGLARRLVRLLRRRSAAARPGGAPALHRVEPGGAADPVRPQTG